MRMNRMLSGSLLGCLSGFVLLSLAAAAQTSAPNEWTWMSGSSTLNCTESTGLGNYCLQPGVYGTLGTPAAGNVPGSRVQATSWTDSSGNLWLYSGGCVNADGTSGSCGDFWEFNPTTGEWTWKGGSTSANQSALVYGTMGTPAAGNFPGNRVFGASWTDSNGNFWGYGGDVNDVFGDVSIYGDLWEFNPSTNEWAWMGGSSTPNAPGVYGTLGTPDAENFPGYRMRASGWTDSSGNLWLFGGSDGEGDFNDLWEFNPLTNQWTWMGGSSVIGNNCPGEEGTGSSVEWVCGQAGVYGTLGTPAAGNLPGSRENAASWTDSSGHFWLFGGGGFDANGVAGELNDLWEFDPTLNEWAWMGGSSNVNQNAAVYGVMGIPAAGNIPEGRWGASSWTDRSGNFWLFGGTVSYGNTNLNDLWEFNPTTNLWAWMGGSSSINQPGVYGTLGNAAAGNIPGSRWGVSSWTDNSGNLWLFGGGGFDGTNGLYFNDLWEYQPSAPSLPAATTPTFSPAAGTFTTTQTVTINDTTPNAAIYYTTDGVTTPTINSSLYGSGNPIMVSSTETIQAIAVAANYQNSAVASATYTITIPPPAAAPTFSVPAGSYATSQTVAISDTTSGATIYYTTDGTQPTASSTVYSAPISVASSETIEAIATVSGYSTSAVASAGYFITPLAVGGTLEWTWMGGSSTVPETGDGSGGQSGVYGTLGTPAAGNIPGSRQLASTWTDSSGNLWLFGGTGFDASGNWGTLNDLWEFNPSTNQWDWMGGGNNISQPGVYGTLGVPAAGNIPGYRQGATSWTDSSGNLWLFGGTPGAATGFLNDLWEFNPSTNQWAWISGNSTMQCANNGYGLTICGQTGMYGTLGVPAAGNVPRGRTNATGWTDSSGNFWLFGGWGMTASGNWSGLNDLWEFNPSTSEWAWMGGSSTDASNCFITDRQSPNGSLCGPAGVYGTLGTPAAGNVPGGRYGITSWTDNGGNLWLFGGYGFDVNGNFGYLNDLWEFNPSMNEWSWMGGSSAEGDNGCVAANSGCGQPGVYGTLGVPAAGNIPGGRNYALSWTDRSGNFWLFGGYGADARGPGGYLNDLWEFNPSTNHWAWMGGSSMSGNNCIQAHGDTLCGQSGIFGTLGAPASGNIPGGREDSTAKWTDNNGNFWLFGGWGYDANGNLGYLNDLWEYQPPAPSIPAAAKPAFSAAAGTYTTAQTVTISDATPNATIYYTTNGTKPTTNSNVYSVPITVSTTETLEAIAAASGDSTSAVATATYIITLPQAATPTYSEAAGNYTATQTVTMIDAMAGATIYYTTDGSTPNINSPVYSGPITVSSTETLQAMATAGGYSQSGVASAVFTLNISTNPTPVISSISPASDSAGGAAFTLTVNGFGFIDGSTVYWGSAALTTTYVSANQITAQVTADEIANAGISTITVQTPSPGGGTSTAFQFEVDSASGTTTGPVFSSTAATVASGSSASFQATLPAAVTSTTVTCLNLPAGAACSYSATTNTVTITTSPTTPAGTYLVTVVFTETVSDASTSWILLPVLLLPLAVLRKKLAARGVWVTACLGVVLLAATVFSVMGCGGGSSNTTSITPKTHQATSSGAVTMTVK